jgi:hypothetical protein
VGREEENTWFWSIVLFIVSTSQQEINVCSTAIRYQLFLKSGLLHLTGQPYCKKGRSAKVKNGIINLILRNYLVDRYTIVTLAAVGFKTFYLGKISLLFYQLLFTF